MVVADWQLDGSIDGSCRDSDPLPQTMLVSLNRVGCVGWSATVFPHLCLIHWMRRKRLAKDCVLGGVLMAEALQPLGRVLVHARACKYAIT